MAEGRAGASHAPTGLSQAVQLQSMADQAASQVPRRMARGELWYGQVASRDLLGGRDVLCECGFPQSNNQ